MREGIKFDALMDQPGPDSAPPTQSPAMGGGTILKDAIMNVNKTAPMAQARMATQAALDDLKKLAHKFAQERHSQ